MANPSAPRKSPFPTALVARVPSSDKDKTSGTLVPRHMGYLCVRVTFHKEPVAGLMVKLSKATDAGKPGKAMGEPTRTNAQGVVRIDRLVPAGSYVCEIENQDPAVVTTVLDERRPFVVVLPVGRPYLDAEEASEFDDDPIDHEPAPAEAQGK